VLDLKRVAVFREVVRQGSFSAAAAALNYSQPAVSHHVARLELELGVQLWSGRGPGWS
jgi:DNA-binding transcriptional LysR family regulator